MPVWMMGCILEYVYSVFALRICMCNVYVCSAYICSSRPLLLVQGDSPLPRLALRRLQALQGGGQPPLQPPPPLRDALKKHTSREPALALLALALAEHWHKEDTARGLKE
jgi:hypothetical protein